MPKYRLFAMQSICSFNLRTAATIALQALTSGRSTNFILLFSAHATQPVQLATIRHRAAMLAKCKAALHTIVHSLLALITIRYSWPSSLCCQCCFLEVQPHHFQLFAYQCFMQNLLLTQLFSCMLCAHDVCLWHVCPSLLFQGVHMKPGC